MERVTAGAHLLTRKVFFLFDCSIYLRPSYPIVPYIRPLYLSSLYTIVPYIHVTDIKISLISVCSLYPCPLYLTFAVFPRSSFFCHIAGSDLLTLSYRFHWFSCHWQSLGIPGSKRLLNSSHTYKPSVPAWHIVNQPGWGYQITSTSRCWRNFYPNPIL